MLFENILQRQINRQDTLKRTKSNENYFHKAQKLLCRILQREFEYEYNKKENYNISQEHSGFQSTNFNMRK